MGFLAPSVFVLGGALVLAILATYFLRPRRPARRVSSTFLWLAALNDLQAQRPWRRIPPSLLLLLQLAALTALIAALARPFLLTAESTGLDTIVLLDASASMQATDVSPSRFEAARRRVTQLIDGLEPGQSLALVALDGQPRVIAQPSDDRAQVRRALEALRPTTQAANLPVALSIAESLAEGHPGAQVVVIADGSIDRAGVPAAFALPLRFEAVGSPKAANLAVAGLSTRVVGGRVTALGRVVNYGPQPVSATLELRVDGTRFDARLLNIDPGGEADAQWDDLPAAAHTLEARLDQPDSLALDDAAWAVLDGDRSTRVLLVSDGNVFVEQALALRPGTQVTHVSPGDYTPQPQAFDLLVLDGFVPAALPAGSSVLLLHPPANNGLVTVGPEVAISSIGAARQNDTLLADVPLASVHVTRSRSLEAPAWADTVLTSPETPVLLVGEQSGRRLGVLGFDVHQSDLPLQPGFPVLVQHLLDWLVPRSSTATPVVQVGESISIAPLPEAVSVDVVAPDGSRSQVVPPLPALPFGGTDLPGLYHLVQRDAGGRETTTFFAVNFLNPAESALRPGAGSGPPGGGPRRDPLKAPHEVWEALAVVGLALLAIEAALAWWQFTAATFRARLALGLRLAMAALVVLALLGMSWPQTVERQATVFVADVSASVSDAQSDSANFISQAVAAKGADDLYAIVAAARSAAVVQNLSVVRRSFNGTDGASNMPLADGTDLSAGLRLASNLLPAAYRPRVVLLSDGQETNGDAVVQARLLQARGIEVDVLPLSGSSGPEVLVDSVSAPSVVHEGERFSIGVRVVSNVATEATLHVSVNGQPLADQSLSISPGTTDLAYGAQAPQAGLIDVRASVQAQQDTLLDNNEARSVVEVQGPPSVLIVEQRPGESTLIGQALASSGMRLETRAVSDLPDQIDALGGFAAVVLADVSADSLSEAQQTTLRSYVRDLGRGLLAIGGDTSFGQGQYIGTPLDDALPVRSSVRSHQDQGRVALLLVIDTSGSMSDDIYHEGTTKMDMAKEAALLSAQQLGPRDQVGILTFDSTQHWILPLTNLLGLGGTALQDRLAPLMADGGTDIYPAMSTAFDAIKSSDARYKHVILMTDGMSCCGGNYADLLDRMRAANVTLSTIAIGGDADQQLLAQLARQGDGRYYFADHARDIPRLMTRETELAIRGPLVEGNVTPRQVGPDALLSSVAANGMPPLSGYLVTSPKDLAEVLLVSDAADPLLARWQYGLGRAVAWTSDLRGRWTEQWVTWPGTAHLFSGLVGWTIAPAQGPFRVAVRADAQTGHVSVEETQPGQQPAQVQVRVAQPGGAAMQIDLAATGPGRYAGTFPLNGVGTYIVRAQAQRDGAVVGTAEAGLPVSYPAEFRRVSADPRRLEQIALAGGGHVLTSPSAAFANDLAPISVPLPLQRTLLLLAAILLPLEVGLRRLRLSPMDAVNWLRHPHRLDVVLPWRRSADEGLRPAAWMPGRVMTRRRTNTVVNRPLSSESTLGSQVTPGLARQTDDEDAADDALGSTLKWLAARRGTTTGDRG